MASEKTPPTDRELAALLRGPRKRLIRKEPRRKLKRDGDGSR